MESKNLGDGPCRLLGLNSGCINVVRAGTRFVLELRELFDLAVSHGWSSFREGLHQKG